MRLLAQQQPRHSSREATQTPTRRAHATTHPTPHLHIVQQPRDVDARIPEALATGEPLLHCNGLRHAITQAATQAPAVSSSSCCISVWHCHRRQGVVLVLVLPLLAMLQLQVPPCQPFHVLCCH